MHVCNTNVSTLKFYACLALISLIFIETKLKLIKFIPLDMPVHG